MKKLIFTLVLAISVLFEVQAIPYFMTPGIGNRRYVPVEREFEQISSNLQLKCEDCGAYYTTPPGPLFYQKSTSTYYVKRINDLVPLENKCKNCSVHNRSLYHDDENCKCNMAANGAWVVLILAIGGTFASFFIPYRRS